MKKGAWSGHWQALMGFLALCCIFSINTVLAQTATQQVIDLPARPGITQRALLLTPPAPKAAVIMLAGGHGGLQIYQGGSMRWGEGNFLVRTRQLFADQGLVVAVLDAPSDRQNPPFLNGFRQTPEHVADVRAAIKWLRDTTGLPVWLMGTSRGTQSAAYVATELHGKDGPDGIVLSSTILVDEKTRAVPAMALDKIDVPVLLVHHEQDACGHCPYSSISNLMSKFVNVPRKHVLAFQGGQTKGDPCEAFAHHGFNGLEADVVSKTTAWILAQ